MNEFMIVKLSEGRRVRNPANQHVLELGREYKVKKTQFWLKRLEEKDIFEVQQTQPEALKEKKVSEKKKEKGE